MIIRGGRVFDAASGKDEIADVGITKGVIGAVGNLSGAHTAYFFNASGYTVTTAFTDAHMHILPYSSFGVQGESCCFPAGVTSCADAGGNAHLGENTFYMPDPQRLPGTLKAGRFIFCDIKDNNIDEDLIKKRIENAKARVIGLKCAVDVGFQGITDERPLAKLKDLARSLALKVMVHSTHPPVSMSRILACLDKGDICTHVFHGWGHTVAEDGFESLKEAKERGVIADVAGAAGLHISFDIAKKAIKAGVLPDTVSTDVTDFSVYRRNGIYNMTACMSHMLALGMEERDILRAVTVNAANALGFEEVCGMLEPGRAADIAIIRLIPCSLDCYDRFGGRVHLDRMYECVLTVCDGRIVWRSPASADRADVFAPQRI